MQISFLHLRHKMAVYAALNCISAWQLALCHQICTICFIDLYCWTNIFDLHRPSKLILSKVLVQSIFLKKIPLEGERPCFQVGSPHLPYQHNSPSVTALYLGIYRLLLALVWCKSLWEDQADPPASPHSSLIDALSLPGLCDCHRYRSNDHKGPAEKKKTIISFYSKLKTNYQELADESSAI